MSDRYFKTGKYRGYMWCVRRTEAGTVCCYINVSQNAYFRDIWLRRGSFSEADSIMHVHGGVTYFSKGVPRGADREWPDDIVVGYDYGHYGDTPMCSLSSVFYRNAAPSAEWMTSIISEGDAETGIKAAIDEMLVVADA